MAKRKVQKKKPLKRKKKLSKAEVSTERCYRWRRKYPEAYRKYMREYMREARNKRRQEIAAKSGA